MYCIHPFRMIVVFLGSDAVCCVDRREFLMDLLLVLKLAMITVRFLIFLYLLVDQLDILKEILSKSFKVCVAVNFINNNEAIMMTIFSLDLIIFNLIKGKLLNLPSWIELQNSIHTLFQQISSKVQSMDLWRR